MDPLQLLVGYGFVVIILLLTFLRLRRVQRPSSLRMQNQSSDERFSPPKEHNLRLVKDFSEERTLNVYFNHNGHSWDAYEALGVPAGCGRDLVETAYRDLSARLDSDSKEFIQRGFDAILIQRGWK